jgi:threonine dehydrogenase-like Zn-dependent dehydrogenase
MVTGIPAGEQALTIRGAELIRQLVLKNQIMAGSVNAARGHFQIGVEDLTSANSRWPGHIEKLITHRYGYADYEAALTRHETDEIKTVIEWKKPG